MTTTLLQSKWGGHGLPEGESSNTKPRTTEDTHNTIVDVGVTIEELHVACCIGVGSLACATHSSTRQPQVLDTLS